MEAKPSEFEFLATVRRGRGKRTTVNVLAGSADDALRKLRDQGYDQVTLHTDDVSSLTLQQRKHAAILTPRDYLIIRDTPYDLGTAIAWIRAAFRKTWVTNLILALVLVQLRLTGWPWGILDTILLVAILFPILVGFMPVLATSPRRARYRQLLKDMHWGRHEKVLARLERLRGVPARELIRCKARALAGLGRVDEALALLEPLADGVATPRWYYHALRGQIYDAAQDLPASIREQETALALAPDNSTILIGLGRRVIWHERNAKRARGLLDQARTHAISDLQEPHVLLLEGLILLEENRPHDALVILDHAYRLFHARRHQPASFLPLDETRLAQARAHAALGDRARALKLYASVYPRLVANGSKLVDRLNHEIGTPQFN